MVSPSGKQSHSLQMTFSLGPFWLESSGRTYAWRGMCLALPNAIPSTALLKESMDPPISPFRYPVREPRGLSPSLQVRFGQTGGTIL